MSRRNSNTETPSTNSNSDDSLSNNTPTTTDATNASTVTQTQITEPTSTPSPSSESEVDLFSLPPSALRLLLSLLSRSPEAEPESATPDDLTDLLQYYQCPFEVNPELLCSFYERYDGMCPFGHRLNAITTTGIEPSELPSYICVLYLLGKCHNDRTVGRVSQLTRCKAGMHLTTAELMDNKQIQEMLATEVLDADSRWEKREQEVEQIIRRCVEAVDNGRAEEEETETNTVDATVETDETAESVEGSESAESTEVAEVAENLNENANDQPDSTALPPTEEPECCSICYDELASVEDFGLLEKCDHAFCAKCILTWHRMQNRRILAEKTCPYCRLESSRVIVWPASKIVSTERKAAIFDLQYRCFRIANGDGDETSSSSSSSVAEDENEILVDEENDDNSDTDNENNEN